MDRGSLAVSDAQILVAIGTLGGDMELVRTAFDGTVLGTLPMPEGCQNDFAAAGDGRSFLIACSTGGTTTLGRIAEDGTLSWMPEPFEGGYPVLEPGGGDVLLLRSTSARGLTALLLRAGVPLGTDMVLGPSGYTRVAAYGAGRFLVVHSGEDGRIATFVSRDGGVQPVAGPLFPAAQISLAFDGSTFLVAGLEDGRAGSIFLRRLRLDGTWVEPEPRRVGSFSTGPGPFGSILNRADLASDGSGSALLVFPRYVAELPFATLRVHAHWLTTGAPLGDPCRSDEDCGSGACARGRCCAAACDGACEACSARGLCTTFCDAGAPDAGDDASSSSRTDAGVAPPRTVPGCACRVARGESKGGLLVLALAVCAVLGRSRR